ncbi:hypothetical protein A3L04_05540 [Thermococcus chitonophagus]|uniref:Uncharacterized protein n=1 Tax=Thermococcus chitonophagus TaxID=54262 RepID=A0A160VRG7_9EURY|nr:hypothetical protein [Thermococcus chitonophagus]ASJ16570.1 hypothetical protein A3L04_05540 [Thermococcus chitonophagus]CUX77515.1 hypothetical protein CHITON_0736 [Thermococcus chitonophagus]
MRLVRVGISMLLVFVILSVQLIPVPQVVAMNADTNNDGILIRRAVIAWYNEKGKRAMKQTGYGTRQK